MPLERTHGTYKKFQIVTPSLITGFVIGLFRNGAKFWYVYNHIGVKNASELDLDYGIAILTPNVLKNLCLFHSKT